MDDFEYPPHPSSSKLKRKGYFLEWKRYKKRLSFALKEVEDDEFCFKAWENQSHHNNKATCWYFPYPKKEHEEIIPIARKAMKKTSLNFMKSGIRMKKTRWKTRYKNRYRMGNPTNIYQLRKFIECKECGWEEDVVLECPHKREKKRKRKCVVCRAKGDWLCDSCDHNRCECCNSVLRAFERTKCRHCDATCKIPCHDTKDYPDEDKYCEFCGEDGWQVCLICESRKCLTCEIPLKVFDKEKCERCRWKEKNQTDTK